MTELIFIESKLVPRMLKTTENPLQPKAAHYLLIVKQHKEFFLQKATMIGALELNTPHVFLMRQASSIEGDCRRG